MVQYLMQLFIHIEVTGNSFRWFSWVNFLHFNWHKQQFLNVPKEKIVVTSKQVNKQAKLSIHLVPIYHNKNNLNLNLA